MHRGTTVEHSKGMFTVIQKLRGPDMVRRGGAREGQQCCDQTCARCEGEPLAGQGHRAAAVIGALFKDDLI